MLLISAGARNRERPDVPREAARGCRSSEDALAQLDRGRDAHVELADLYRQH